MAKTTTERRERGVDVFRRAFPQARCLWQGHIARVGNIESFWLGNTQVIVQEYDGGNGWNVFTPTTDEGRIDLTIKAVAARCGVDAADTVTEAD